jgi:hypothetical protein
MELQGIYALYKDRKLRYVGLAEDDIDRRLRDHCTDSLRNAWDSFSFYCLSDIASPYLHDLEASLHRISGPTRNKQIGRFVSAKDVSAIIQGRVNAGGLIEFIENGAIHPGTRLRMRWGGHCHTALVSPSGQIKCEGHFYKSPSGAGRAIAHNNVDGWAWWHYEVSAGVWRPLTILRGVKLRWMRARSTGR